MSGAENPHGREAVAVSEPLSLAARIIGPVTSTVLKPLLRGGLAPRRGLLAAVGVAIGQRVAGTAVQQSTLGGVPVEIATPPGPAGPVTVLYLHGGAFAAMSSRSHRRLVTYLAAASGCRVVSVDYRLAPEHPYPAGLEDAVTAYTAALADQPRQRIVLAGDSAGGGLALATALAVRDRGLAMPAALALIAPWVDLTCSGASMTTHADRERVLTKAGLSADARRYAGGEPLDSPRVSPLFADLSGLPPMLIQVGADEVFVDDATRLAERARAAGGSVKLQVWQHLWHVWHLYAGLLPEADAALRDIAAFIGEQTGGDTG